MLYWIFYILLVVPASLSIFIYGVVASFGFFKGYKPKLLGIVLGGLILSASLTISIGLLGWLSPC